METLNSAFASLGGGHRLRLDEKNELLKLKKKRVAKLFVHHIVYHIVILSFFYCYYFIV